MLARSTGSHIRSTVAGTPDCCPSQLTQDTHVNVNFVCNRSGIYVHSDEQAAAAKQHLEELNVELGVRLRLRSSTNLDLLSTDKQATGRRHRDALLYV